MTESIRVSDEVYERLEQKRGDRSYNEVIAELLDQDNTLSNVAGQQIFDPETTSDVSNTVESLSEGLLDKRDTS